MINGQFDVTAVPFPSLVFPSGASAARCAITNLGILPLMTRIGLALALLLCNAPARADILVGYRFEAEDLNGNLLANNTITVGQDFQLAAFVRDVRSPQAPHPGVFAGFVNVAYGPLATIPAGAVVAHDPLQIHGGSTVGI